MVKLRYLLKNASLLNLVLVITLVYLVKTIALPFFGAGVVDTQPVVKKQVTAAPAKGKVAETKGPSPFDYVIIGDQNLFHPERKIPVPKVEAPPLPKPDFVLYGTMETEDLSVAYMEDKKAPKTTLGRGKRVTTMKPGDSLSGFVLKEIDADKVVMMRGDESMVVHLMDRGKVREGGGAATGASAITQPPPKSPVTPLPPAQMAPAQEQPAGTKPVVQPVRPARARARRGIFGAEPSE